MPNLLGHFSKKYGNLFSWAEISPNILEKNIRNEVHTLWRYPNELFTILAACSQAEPSGGKSLEEIKAISGSRFCREVLSIIDFLQIHRDDLPLGEMREALVNLISLIKENLGKKFGGESSSIQFPHVSELIFQMIPVRSKQDRVYRDQQFGKAKTGLSRIMGLAISMSEKMDRLEAIAPEKFSGIDIDHPLPERFKPQRAPLSIHDIVDFIRQHGDEYGVQSQDDWSLALTNDHQLKEQMTTVINAINRGHVPKDGKMVKEEIARIIKAFKERKEKLNFEDEETL
jgi:hypothetical protein